MKFKIFTKLALCLSAVLLLSSCSDDDNNYYYNNPNPNAAYGIIANASPDSGDLYFFANANQINNAALNYGSANGYYDFYTGDRTLTIKNNAGDSLATANITLVPGQYFSAFAVNTFNNIELVTYNDALDYPEAGHALVRFINLSPDADAVTITGLTQTFATGLSFKAATDFISVQSGSYDINYALSATDVALYSDTAVEFKPGGVYTIYTKGYVTPPTGSNDTFSTKKMRNY